MTDTLIGTVQEGWGETQLSDLCDLIPGAPTQDDPSGTVPVLKPKNLVSGRLHGETDTMDAAEAAERPRYLVRPCDLLCVRTGTVGRSALADNKHAGNVFGTGLICVRVNDPRIDPQFLSAYITHPAVTDWIVRQAKGTSVPNISAKILGTLPVTVPPLEVQRSIARVLETLNESIEAHRQIVETSEKLRDAVLPLLITGELSAGGREAPLSVRDEQTTGPRRRGRAGQRQRAVTRV